LNGVNDDAQSINSDDFVENFDEPSRAVVVRELELSNQNIVNRRINYNAVERAPINHNDDFKQEDAPT